MPSIGVASSRATRVDFDMNAGDMLIVNNLAVLHARTPFEDSRGTGAARVCCCATGSTAGAGFRPKDARIDYFNGGALRHPEDRSMTPGYDIRSLTADHASGGVANLGIARDEAGRPRIAAGFRLVRLASAIQKKVSRLYLEPHRLTNPDWRVLGFVHRYGPVKSSLLTERTSLDKAQVSRTVKKLAAQKLVRVAADPRHAPTHVLDLTAAGRRLYDRILPRRHAPSTA